jgi:hypothetical protein
MKAIVMRQTKTLPLITLIERIFTDRRAAGTKKERAGKRLRWDEDGCDWESKS